MAIAYCSYEQFVKMIKRLHVYKIRYEDNTYNLGTRYIFMPYYYFFNHQNLKMEIFLTSDDLLLYAKIKGKSIKDCWDKIEILDELPIIDWHDEEKIIKKNKAYMEE